jgi:predicted RNase H-like nuclease
MQAARRYAVLMLFVILPSTAAQTAHPVDPHLLDAKGKRAARERAVAKIGPSGRAFIETYGEDAVAAVFKCSAATGRKLAEFYQAGSLEKFRSPSMLLLAIAREGDPVAAFAMEHAKELSDPECFDVFLLDPMTYAMKIRTLAAGVEGYRRYLELAQRRQEKAEHDDKVTKLVVAGVVLLVGLLIWRARRRGDL